MNWIKSTKFFFVLLSIIAVGLIFWVFFETIQLKKSQVTSWLKVIKGDCGLVLTGGPGRVRAGFDLLQRGDIRKLVISGVNPNVTLENIFPQIDLYPAVQRYDIILENRSRTTYGNAVQSAGILKTLGCQKVLVVTSQLHMPRALKVIKNFSPSIEFEPYSVYADPTQSHLMYESLKTVFYNIWF